MGLAFSIHPGRSQAPSGRLWGEGQEAAFTGLVPAPFDGGYKLSNLAAGEVFSVICHFVRFSG